MSKAGTINLNIKPFDLSKCRVQVGNAYRSLVYGPSGSGKSSLILELLSHNLDVPVVSVMCPTEKFNHTYKGIVPPAFIHDFSKEGMKQFIYRQEFISDKCKNDPRYKDVDPRGIYVFDDCLHKIKKIREDEDIDFMFIAGRHVSMCPIFALQDPIGLSPVQRGQISYTFLFYDPLQTNREKLYQHYAGVFPTKKCFFEVYDAVTQNYGYLVIDNTNKQARSLEEKVFWGRTKPASMLRRFKTCDPKYWNMRPNNEIDEDSDDDKYNRNPRYERNTRLNIRRLKNSGETNHDDYNPNVPGWNIR